MLKKWRKTSAAIWEFTDLGSAKIAMRSGDPRSRQPSRKSDGHMEAVGTTCTARCSTAVKQPKGELEEDVYTTTMDSHDAIFRNPYPERISEAGYINGLPASRTRKMDDMIEADCLGIFQWRKRNFWILLVQSSCPFRLCDRGFQKGDAYQFTMYEKRRYSRRKYQLFTGRIMGAWCSSRYSSVLPVPEERTRKEKDENVLELRKG